MGHRVVCCITLIIYKKTGKKNKEREGTKIKTLEKTKAEKERPKQIKPPKARETTSHNKASEANI